MAGERISDLIFFKVREAVGQAIKDQQDTLDEVSREAANNIGTAQIEAMSLSGGGLLGFFAEFLPISPLIEPLKLILGSSGGIVEGVTVGWALGTALYPVFQALLLPFIHAVNDATQNEIHDPTTAADLVARGLTTHSHGADEAAGGGFDGDHFNRLVGLGTTHPDATVLAELHRRGIVDTSFVTTTLKRLGYSDEAIPHLMGLERTLLSPADLALAELRGVISSQVMYEYAAQLGVTQADMDVLVGDTGEPPAPQELLFAYRRGFIDKNRLEHGIRQSRIRNEWLDVIEMLRFAPMSTADAIRAVVQNYMHPTDAQAIAEQNGLEPTHFEPLLLSAGRPLAHGEMASLVHRGLASRAQFDQAMRESDIKDKYLQQSFELGERLLPERIIVQALKFGAISTQDAAKRLMQLGYSQASAAILLKLGIHESEVRPHELTANQIATLYENGTIHRDEAVKHMESIGYSAANANYVLTLADMRLHIKEVTAEEKAIRLSYLASGITADQARSQLQGIGVNAAQAEHLISVWNREKHRAARTLSEAQIVKAAVNQTIAYDEAVTLLEASGYTRSDATILLQSNGATIPKTPTVQPGGTRRQ